MAAIAAHFRYISKCGRLAIEDDRGVIEQGKDAVKEIERQWQYGGAYIDCVGHRCEAFNVMLSMPRGTDPLIVQKAAREFAKIEFADHRLRDGSAHSPRPSARAPERQGRVEARSAAQPEEGRPAPLARDVCRTAAGVGSR